MNTSYASTTPHTEKFIHLVGDLQADLKSLIRKEIELAKAEMGEKFSSAARNAAFGAAGGVLGLFAAFMMILGLGAIMARLLILAGLSPGLSYFASFMGLALVLGAIAYALIQKAMHAFSKLSLTPTKARFSAQAADPVPIEIKKKVKMEKAQPKPGADQLQKEVIATRVRMDTELSELKARLKPGYMGRSLWAGLKHHPLRAVLVSAASTGLGGYLYWRKQQRIAFVKQQAVAFRRPFFLRLRRS